MEEVQVYTKSKNVKKININMNANLEEKVIFIINDIVQRSRK
jgi:hypothetical protein